MNRIFFDTEFIEDGTTIDLISIGAVKEDGSTFYAVSNEYDASKASDWVIDNVLNHISPHQPKSSRQEIGEAFRLWAGDNPEFWAYYADYDWVVLCQLYGTMMQLPPAFPMFCMDIKQLCVDLGNPRLPQQSDREHCALDDAMWNMQAFNFLDGIRKGKK